MTALHSERLRLEPLVSSHADALFEGLHDRRLYEFVAEEPPARVEHLRERYTKLARRTSPDGSADWLNWAVWCIDEDRYIGFVQATIDRDRIPTIGYVLFYDAWGRGYAREAVACAIAYLTERYRPNALRATVDTRNRASISLLENLGFVLAAMHKKAEWIGGVCTDEAEYRLAVKTQG